MKPILILFILLFSMGCSENKITNTQLVEKYYDGFQSSNFLQVKNVIDDSLTTVYGDYITNFTKKNTIRNLNGTLFLSQIIN